MKTITTIGLDIAKSVFQVHGIDAAGDVVIRQQLKRARVMPFFKKLPPCVVGISSPIAVIQSDSMLMASTPSRSALAFVPSRAVSVSKVSGLMFRRKT